MCRCSKSFSCRAMRCCAASWDVVVSPDLRCLAAMSVKIVFSLLSQGRWCGAEPVLMSHGLLCCSGSWICFVLSCREFEKDLSCLAKDSFKVACWKKSRKSRLEDRVSLRHGGKESRHCTTKTSRQADMKKESRLYSKKKYGSCKLRMTKCCVVSIGIARWSSPLTHNNFCFYVRGVARLCLS